MLALASGGMTEIWAHLSLAAIYLTASTMCGSVVSWELIIPFSCKENVPKDISFEEQHLIYRP